MVTGERYPDALKVVSSLLENWDKLEDKEALPALIEVFEELNVDGRVNFKPLRDILADQEVNPAAREAAANALGSLHDVESLPLLQDTVRKPSSDLLLREAAIDSLGRLGLHLKDKPESTCEIKNFLVGLLKKKQEPKRVVEAAIEAFAKIADAAQVNVLFPFLKDRHLRIRAGLGIRNIILRLPPQDTLQVVKLYLEWRLSMHADSTGSDEAFLGPESTHEDNAEEAVKLIVPALAALQLDDGEAVPKQGVDLYAKVLSDQVLRDAPRLDNAKRREDLEAWNNWWQKNHPRLRLIGYQLIPRKPSR